MKTLKSFEFSETGGKRAAHDWDAILSGKIVLLERGKDYTCKDTTMATLCRTAARKRGMVVKTGKAEDDAGLVVQAVKASPEQLKAWADADAAKQSGDQTAE